MRTLPIIAFLVLSAFVTAADPSDGLSLRIEIANGRVRGFVRNTSTNTVTVPHTFGWWEFTTVLYHDGQKWREAPLREALQTRLGAAQEATLEPNEILLAKTRSVHIGNPDLTQCTFVLDLSAYALPKDLTNVRQLRIVTSGLWSDIQKMDNPNNPRP